MTPRGFGMGFFGRHPFNMEEMKKMKEEWSKMSDSEKLEVMNNRMSAFDKFDEDRFSVEAIDARCEKWMEMTQEEKEQFVNERKKAIEEKFSCMGGFFGHGGFGFKSEK